MLYTCLTFFVTIRFLVTGLRLVVVDGLLAKRWAVGNRKWFIGTNHCPPELRGVAVLVNLVAAQCPAQCLRGRTEQTHRCAPSVIRVVCTYMVLYGLVSLLACQ